MVIEDLKLCDGIKLFLLHTYKSLGVLESDYDIAFLLFDYVFVIHEAILITDWFLGSFIKY